MADFIGGDILEVTVNHPTLGESKFQCKAQEDGTFDRGGFTTEDDQASITGAGSAINKMSRKRWRVELPPISWDQIDNDELEKLQAMSNSPLSGDWTIAVINGAVFSGNGRIVGDLTGQQYSATASVIISGGGTLDKIS